MKDKDLSLAQLQELLVKQGYYAQRPELQALKWLRDGKLISGTKSLLLEGLPGVGKTFFCECSAKALNMPYHYYLFHSWSDDQDMFKGVDVVEAVAGNSAKVALPGILARASKDSQTNQVMVVLDEVDKTEDRTQNLLLDWLQTGRAQWAPGEHIQGDVKNLLVCITSNATKPISPALMRRLRRLRMTPLPQDVQIDIISHNTSIPKAKVKPIVEVGYKVADLDKRDISLQELTNLAVELLSHCECCHDQMEAVASWCLRSNRNRTQADQLCNDLQSLLETPVH